MNEQDALTIAQILGGVTRPDGKGGRCVVQHSTSGYYTVVINGDCVCLYEGEDYHRGEGHESRTIYFHKENGR
jgi:hypothetical protein